jgi:integrase
MQHLRIFQNENFVKLNNASAKIIETLSNNHLSIIDGMVGKSTTTKNTYKTNVKHFMAFIQSNGINSQSYGAFRNALEKVEVVSDKTKNAYLSAAKALLRESTKYGILPIDITANVPLFKVSAKHVKDGLSENETKEAWKYISSIKREATRRKVEVLFRLMAAEGFRQDETQKIKIEDINTKDATIKISSKGLSGKETVEVFRTTAALLESYISYLGKDSGYLFASKSKANQPITLRAIRKIFTCPQYGIFAKCGITGRSVHGFRHFFTTKTLELTNGDLNKTSLRTRHKSTSTLKVYDDRRINKKEMMKMESAFMFD